MSANIIRIANNILKVENKNDQTVADMAFSIKCNGRCGSTSSYQLRINDAFIAYCQDCLFDRLRRDCTCIMHVSNIMLSYWSNEHDEEHIRLFSKRLEDQKERIEEIKKEIRRRLRLMRQKNSKFLTASK